MQFIDQAPAYSQKSISLDKAIQLGRAKLTAEPGAEKLVLCLRPELAVANAFDRSINARLKFAELSTPDKLDLLIDELLPGFYHAELLPRTGRETWVVRFAIDGNVQRTLTMDGDGMRAIENDPDQTPDVELETDIITLMAMLRSVIAEFHLKTPSVTASSVSALGAGEES